MRMLARLLALVALLGVGAGAYWYFTAYQGTGMPAAAQGSGGPAPGPSGPPGGMPVEAQTVETGSVSRTVTSVGTLFSDESVVIRPEVAGTSHWWKNLGKETVILYVGDVRRDPNDKHM